MNSELLIKKHEGKRNKVYYDSEGIMTVGYGYNLEKGLSDQAVDFLFSESMNDVYADCLSFHWYGHLSTVRRAVIENMLFNLGRQRFLGFKRTIQHIESGEYDKAADEMLDSKWARQVGYRANELSEMMRTDTWPS
jgi:lysozyme